MEELTVGVRPKSDYYIRQVCAKLATGDYATEVVACVCGSSDAQPVTSHDRYGIPYQMNLCRVCGVGYASPRMTEASMQQFYQTEYRLIYDEAESSKDEEFSAACQTGEGLWDVLQAFDQVPKTVIDLGCNMGGMLHPFHAHGCDVLGVDLDGEAIARGQAKGVPILQGTFDDLIVKGKRADLVILHHVFEHCFNLPAVLAQIALLLKPTGVLYLAMPGLKVSNQDRLWQSAHTYQFTYDTLTYVMECHGYEALYCDENIASLWQYAGLTRSLETVHPKAFQEAWECIVTDRRRIPEIKAYNKFPVAQRKANIQQMLAKRMPDIVVLEGVERGHRGVIICGGPSIEGQVEVLKQQIAAGAVVVAIERMVDWCITHAIVPDYAIVLDASDDVMESVSNPVSGVRYIVATQVNPRVMDELAGCEVYIFNSPHNGIPVSDYWDTNGYTQCVILNAGGSVSLAAMSLCFFLGMRQLEIFGFDCHITQGDYAPGITGIGTIHNSYEVEIGTGAAQRVFRTTSPYLAFAQQFFLLVNIARQQHLVDSVNLHGDSLITAMGMAYLQELNDGK
jgi:2-polyprenyl-3-methyl-5-hydroxy-6-metoxy-1,4-benzoquinol methylase